MNWKNDNDVPICRHDLIINFFWRCFVFLVKFSYWSKFHVNIITGSGVMTIFFCKGLTRNPEIRYTEFCLISRDSGKFGIPNLAPMSLMKCYRVLQNARVTAFTASELLGKNQQGAWNYTLTSLMSYARQKEIHFKVRLSLLSIWKLICYWFDKNFVEAITDMYSKNRVLFSGIVVPKSNQHDILSNFISNSCDVFRFCRNCYIFQN